jgi:hypothetical protein
MGVLQDFERRLEGAVEGFFARAFRSGVQPIELAKALQRYATDNQHVTADGVVVPNVYRVTVGPKDHERLAGFGASLPRELGEMLVRTAADRGWTLRGPVKVRVDVDEAVQLGRYRMTGRVEVVDGSAAPAAPAAAGRLRGGSRGGGSSSRTPQAQPVRQAPSPAQDDSSEERIGIDRTQIISGPPRASFALLVRSGSETGQRVPVSGQRLTVGRSSNCGLTLQDTTVSREHAAFVRRGEVWWIVDLGSTNGTRVNGVQAAEQPVAPGDRVELGDAVVEFVEA